MIHAHATKIVNLLTPQSFGTSATVSATVNCVGFQYAEVTLHLATQTAANTDIVTLSEGDTTSSFATSADTNVVTVAPNTSNGQIYKWYLDMRKRKKLLRLQYGPAGTARIGAANIVLSRAEQAPTNTTGGGETVRVVA